MDIVKPSSLELDSQPMSALIVGDAGSGKTSMAATAENPLVLYCDDNELSLRRIAKDYVRITDFNQYQSIYFDIMSEMRAGTFSYSSVIIDCLSATTPLVIKSSTGKDLASLNDWPKIISDWREGIKPYLDFTKPGLYDRPIDVIMTARMTYEKSEADGRMYPWPDVPGRKLPQEVMAWYDEVFRLDCQDVFENGEQRKQYIIYTAKEDGFPAKDGSATLDLIEEPNFAHLKDKIHKGLSAGAE